MSKSQESLDKIQLALRSLFRYNIFQEGNYPEILIEQEEKILLKAFQRLTPQELLYAINIWPEFAKKQAVEQELTGHKIMELVKKEIGSMN